MFLTVQPVNSHELDGLSLSSSLDLNGNPVSEKMARGPLMTMARRPSVQDSSKLRFCFSTPGMPSHLHQLAAISIEPLQA